MDIKTLNELIAKEKKAGNIRTKEISDTHHTIGELYHHRMVLTALVLKLLKNKDGFETFKSWQHDEEGGEMFEDSFIVGTSTPFGQISYHYKKEYWDLFDIPEFERAPKWDGHNPQDTIERFKLLIKHLL